MLRNRVNVSHRVKIANSKEKDLVSCLVYASNEDETLYVYSSDDDMYFKYNQDRNKILHTFL